MSLTRPNLRPPRRSLLQKAGLRADERTGSSPKRLPAKHFVLNSQWLWSRRSDQGLRFNSITVAGAAPDSDASASPPASRSPDCASSGSPDVRVTIGMRPGAVKQQRAACFFVGDRP